MRNSIKQSIKAEHLFIAGILIIPPFIFQNILLFKWLLVFLFMLYAWFTGSRIRIIPCIIMTAGVVSANLLTPIGEVLFSVGSISVTKGALENGLERAALLLGMIYISKFAVSRGLKLPGGRKSILSMVFYYFERIMEGEEKQKDKSGRKKILQGLNSDRLIEIIDKKILSVSELISSQQSSVLGFSDPSFVPDPGTTGDKGGFNRFLTAGSSLPEYSGKKDFPPDSFNEKITGNNSCLSETDKDLSSYSGEADKRNNSNPEHRSNRLLSLIISSSAVFAAWTLFLISYL